MFADRPLVVPSPADQILAHTAEACLAALQPPSEQATHTSNEHSRRDVGQRSVASGDCVALFQYSTDRCDRALARVQQPGSAGHRLDQPQPPTPVVDARQCDQGVDHYGKCVLRRGSCHAAAQLGEQRVLNLRDCGKEALVLVGEVLVERAARNTRRGDDFRDAHGQVSPAQCELDHRLDQASALRASLSRVQGDVLDRTTQSERPLARSEGTGLAGLLLVFSSTKAFASLAPMNGASDRKVIPGTASDSDGRADVRARA